MEPLGINQLIQPVNKQPLASGSRPALCEKEGLLQDAASREGFPGWGLVYIGK